MTALLDEERLAVLRDLYSAERRSELFQLFQEQTTLGLERIAQAAADGEPAAVAAAAHRLASCAASFAGAALHATALRLAHPERELTSATIDELRQQLERLYPATVAALRERLVAEEPTTRDEEG